MIVKQTSGQMCRTRNSISSVYLKSHKTQLIMRLQLNIRDVICLLYVHAVTTKTLFTVDTQPWVKYVLKLFYEKKKYPSSWWCRSRYPKHLSAAAGPRARTLKISTAIRTWKHTKGKRNHILSRKKTCRVQYSQHLFILQESNLCQFYWSAVSTRVYFCNSLASVFFFIFK